MRIMIDIGHPAQVHFFRYIIQNLQKDGHLIKITARDKEVTHTLLKAYGLNYSERGNMRKSMWHKAIGIIAIDYRLYTIAKKFKPDLLLGLHNPYITHVGKLLHKPSIIFTDTENVGIASSLTFPFADVIITPDCFKEKINSNKQIKIRGYKELAYLHPNYFKPDPSVLDTMDISKDEKYIIVRLISWAASHDRNLHGIDSDNELAFIEALEQYGRVVITSEKKMGASLEKYRLAICPQDIHSVLYYAQLYIGEGGTMATEAAVLGTPAIHIESNNQGVASGNSSGNFCELRDNYGMLFFYPDEKQALIKAKEILENPDSKKEWQRKKTQLLAEKIDVTDWMTNFIEKYPLN